MTQGSLSLQSDYAKGLVLLSSLATQILLFLLSYWSASQAHQA